MQHSPFKFLNAYEKADGERFFGREDEVEQLYQMTYQSSLMLVYGQSGSGKTSLIRCGLANRFDATDWFDIYIRRGDNINRALEQALRKAALSDIAAGTSPAEAVEALYSDRLRPIYLVFDQFEELLILGDRQEQQTFFQHIAELLHAPASHCKVILVMREEFIARLYPWEKTIPTLFSKRLRLETMSRDNLLRVITGTVADANISLESGNATAEKILDNLSDPRSGVQLTYLQVYLDKLYRGARKQSDPVTAFSNRLVKETGRLDDVMADFLEEQREAIETALPEAGFELPEDALQILLEQFITPEGTKQPMETAALLKNLSFAAPLIDAALKQLEERRILRNTEEGTYELSHDALAGHIAQQRSPERLWLQEIAQLIKTRYAAYQQTGDLLTPNELKRITPFRERLSLSLEEREFLKKSYFRQLRNRLLYAAIGLLVAIGALALLFTQFRLKDQEKQTMALGDAANAQRLVQRRNFSKAELLALQAYQRNRDTQNDRLHLQHIFEALDMTYWKQQRLEGHDGYVNAVAVSPDGRTFASGGEDGVIKIWQWRNGNDLANWRINQFQAGASIHSLAFDPHQGNVLAGGDNRGGLYLLRNRGEWQKLAVDTLASPGRDGAAANGQLLAFSPDIPYRLIAAGRDGVVRFWKGGETEPYRPAGQETFTAAFHALAYGSGGRVALGSQEGTVYFCRLDPEGRFQVQQRIQEPGRINAIALREDERRQLQMFWAGNWGSLAYGEWPADAAPQRRGELSHGHFFYEDGDSLAGYVNTLALNSAGNLLASGGNDHSIQLWNIGEAEGNLQLTPRGFYLLQNPQDPRKHGWILSLGFLPGGNDLVAGSADHTVKAWILDPEALVQALGGGD